MHSEPPAGDSTDEGAAGSSTERRKFLAGVSALGVAAAMPSLGAAAAAAAATQGVAVPAGSGIVDVHHHFFPAFLVEAAANSAAAATSFLTPAVRSWTPQRALQELDRHGVATAVLSGTAFRALFELSGMQATRQLVRRINEYGGELTGDHPQRFRLFGYLPLPDVEGSLAEIDYVSSKLRPTGFGVFTSYGDKWIGDPQFWPVLEELNRRRATVFCHPDAPNCCVNLLPQVSSGLIEFPYDTGRAVISLLLGGALARFPDIRWIFCHGGAALPTLAGRIRENAKFLVKDLDAVAPRGIDHELQRLYYETANAAFAPTMAALLAYVPLPQLIFGSDFPYVGVGTNLTNLRGLNLPSATLEAILRGNVQRILSA